MPSEVRSTLHQASSLDEISQYYVFPDKQGQLEFIVYDPSQDICTPDPELLLLDESSLLQTIFSVRASGNPKYLGARVPVSTHLDLDLLEIL